MTITVRDAKHFKKIIKWLIASTNGDLSFSLSVSYLCTIVLMCVEMCGEDKRKGEKKNEDKYDSQVNEQLGFCYISDKASLPSVHLLRCSHCDLYHIAAMPGRN